MKHLGKEFLVGCLVLLAVALALVFGWLMGAVGPFHHEVRYGVLYAFAGGVEVGSPVRVSGVKVGKVEAIQFLSGPVREEKEKGVELGAPAGQPEAQGWPQPAPTIKLVVSVADKAAPVVREDSRFYVNMAGIIGERYIEVSPGTPDSPTLAPESVVRGVDPPRIDQLLSQGYGVFGKIQDFLDRNDKPMSNLLHQVDALIADLNQALKGSDKRRLFTLIDNLNEISSHVKSVTRGLDDPETRAFFHRVDELVKRADEIDKASLKKFFQDEGIRAKIF